MAVDKTSPFRRACWTCGRQQRTRYYPCVGTRWLRSETLPYALNRAVWKTCLRNGEERRCPRAELARAGRGRGARGRRWASEVEFSPRPRACSRTSRAFPFSWTSRSCARRAPNWGATRARSTPRFLRPRDRPFGHCRRGGLRRGARREHGARVRAQPRTLRFPELGAKVLRERAHRAAGSRHLPPVEHRGVCVRRLHRRRNCRRCGFPQHPISRR